MKEKFLYLDMRKIAKMKKKKRRKRPSRKMMRMRKSYIQTFPKAIGFTAP